MSISALATFFLYSKLSPPALNPYIFWNETTTFLVLLVLHYGFLPPRCYITNQEAYVDFMSKLHKKCLNYTNCPGFFLIYEKTYSKLVAMRLFRLKYNLPYPSPSPNSTAFLYLPWLAFC